MKKFLTQSLFILASLLMLSTLAHAQTSAGRYEIRLVHNSFDCAKDSVKVCLEIRATSADSAFVMGSSNIYLAFQNNQLVAPVIYSYSNFHDTNIYSFIDLVPTVGANSTIVSLNIVNNGRNGAGTTVGTNWMPIACLRFGIAAANQAKCYSLSINASQPSTVVTRAFPNPLNPAGLSSTLEISQGALTPITNQCPTTPIATLSGGGTIASGGSANLVITSQNNVLPATVVLSGGAGTVTLTSVEPSKTLSVSPTQTTSYTIQSVTGECGTGNGQGTATVTLAPCTAPIVTLSGGGTIASGGSANLVITSQNNVLPATVVLSGGAGTVTITSVEPSKTLSVSPTQTTSYTIQSVTGTCGAGTGQGSASVAVTGGPDPNPCPPGKCVPLTIRVLN